MQGLPPAGSGRGKGPGVPSSQEACGDWDTPQTHGDPTWCPRTPTCCGADEDPGVRLPRAGPAPDSRPRPRGAGSARVPQGVIDSGARTAPAWLADATQSRPTPPPHAPPVLCGSGDIGPPSPPSRVAGCGGRRPFCRLRALTLRPGPRTVTLPGRAGTRVLGPWPELGHETRLPPFAGTAKPSCHRGGRVHFSEQMTSPWAA